MEIPDGLILLEPRHIYDRAIVKCTDECVVYSREKVIKAGIEEFGNYDDSLEWHDYNTFSTYLGEHSPKYI